MNDFFAMRKEPRAADGGNRIARLFNGIESDLIEHIAFFSAFIREPASVGALSPSSKALARAMLEGCAVEKADTVVELGPGTGAFTGPILERLGRHATFFALELDPFYARSLRRRFPGLIVHHDSAERLLDYLARHGKRSANCIICGLPWANLTAEVQVEIMDAILAGLAPKGTFTTFAYFHARWFPKARRFRKNLKSRFRQVVMSPVIWRNLPPAFVYRCSQPIKPLPTKKRLSASVARD